MTLYQQGVWTGLRFRTPAVARLYRLICEQPGLCLAEYERLLNGQAHISRRIVQLERLCVVRSEVDPSFYPPRRLCYPSEAA